jgi:2-C-methyl-D-erythritol 4-phosphate cytidylyltransferase/2-C-methyl-D-erythritol 2,4-cyclodiphosphate synthase
MHTLNILNITLRPFLRTNYKKCEKSMKIIALILAAGRGTRAGGANPKQWQHLGNKRIIDHSIDLFKDISKINNIMVVLHPDDLHLLNRGDVLFTKGGHTRSESVKLGLEALKQNEMPDYVLIHDAARPSTPLSLINNVLDKLNTADAVSPGLPVTDTLWEVIDQEVIQTKSRKNIWRAQTPQGFNFKKILDAHLASSSTATDDVEVATSAGIKVKVIHGSEKNIKITVAEDFDRVTGILGY